MTSGRARLVEIAVRVAHVRSACSYARRAAARLELIETVATEEDAHTIGWDTVGRRLYAFCPGSGGAAVDTEG